MKLADKFKGKPSEFIAYFIAALRTYKKDSSYEFRLGKNYCSYKGPDRYISEPSAMFMQVTGWSFYDLNNYMVWNTPNGDQEYEDLNRFMNVADYMGDGLPYFIFLYLGIPEKYVKPDHYWFLVDLNWEEHVKYIEDYWYKLTGAGL